jgi:hypothetical protein
MDRNVHEIAQNYFTTASLLTLGGASLAVVVVGKTIRTLFKWDSPWPAFIVSAAVCFTGAYSLNALSHASDYLVSILNTCLLFCTALGMNEVAAHDGGLKARGPTAGSGRKHVDWWSSWIR